MEKPLNKIKKISKLPWIFTGLILLAIITVIVSSKLKKPEEPVVPKQKLTNVEVVTIKTQEFTEALTLPAIINADRVVHIKPEFTGVLERWLFPEGGEVHLGDVIAEIDTKAFRLNLDELVAALKTASKNVFLSNISKEKAQVNFANMQENVKIKENALDSSESSLTLAKKSYNRVQKMASQNIATSAQLDNSQNSLTQAELSVIQAKQNLNSANLNTQFANLAIKEADAGIELAEARIVELEASIESLEYRIGRGKLKAPFSGILEAHLIEPGEMASPGTPVAAIYDLKYLRATIDIPDRYIALLDPNNDKIKSFIKLNMSGAEQRIKAKIIIPGIPKLTGEVDNGIELDAEIARIAQSSTPESNTFEVELRFPNPGNALKHGIIARSKIEYLFYPKALIIPVKAIQVTDVGPRVLVVVNENGTEIAALRDIVPASIRGSKALIRKGLQQGDRLIVAGWKGLVGGEKINILVNDGIFKKPE